MFNLNELNKKREELEGILKTNGNFNDNVDELVTFTGCSGCSGSCSGSCDDTCKGGCKGNCGDAK